MTAISGRFAAILADRSLKKPIKVAPKLEGAFIWERIVSYLTQNPGSTTHQIREAIATHYMPTSILNKLKNKGMVRAEYEFDPKKKGVVAKWWNVT